MKNKVKSIKIIGERCSGTNYLELLLMRNFDNIEMCKRYGSKHQMRKKLLIKKILKKDLFIIIHRNPYDWIRSMHKEPHHAPELLYMGFSKFIRNEWKTFDFSDWISINKNQLENSKILEQFENIMQLRNDKLYYFLNLPIKEENIIHIRYEDLKNQKNQTLESIEKKFDLIRKSDFQDITTYKKTNKKYSKSHYNSISKKDLAFINMNINWDQESILNYSPDNYQTNKKSNLINLLKLRIPFAFFRGLKLIDNRLPNIFRSNLRRIIKP